MNPYTAWLYVPAVTLAVIAIFPRRRIIRFSILAVAAIGYWIVIPMYVDWAYTHPFDPDDGGPRTFASLFGWLAGLVSLILPIYLAGRLIRFGALKLRQIRSNINGERR